MISLINIKELFIHKICRYKVIEKNKNIFNIAMHMNRKKENADVISNVTTKNLLEQEKVELKSFKLQ